MWLMLSSGFISVVANRDDKDTLLVRARLEGHIESVFPDAKIFTNEGSDYLYRSFIPREVVMAEISKQIGSITYGNFKNSVKDRKYHDALLEIWTTMWSLQERYNPFNSKKSRGVYHTEVKRVDRAI